MERMCLPNVEAMSSLTLLHAGSELPVHDLAGIPEPCQLKLQSLFLEFIPCDVVSEYGALLPACMHVTDNISFFREASLMPLSMAPPA